MPFSTKAKIVENKNMAPGIFKLILLSPEMAGEVRPGQFFHLQVNDRGYDPLLRRPFSIYDLDRSSGTFSILYRVVGLGTEILTRRVTGEVLEVMGPLGRPFTLCEGDRKVLMVAGGVGIAPLYLLLKELLQKDIAVEVLLGARKAEELVGVKDLESLGAKPEVATEDGSSGFAGLVTELMVKKLKDTSKDISFDRLYSCGPRLMLKEVVKIARTHSLKGEVSLEEVMACGVGACLGCAFPVKTGEHNTVYKRVCAEGPTFSLEEVF